MAFNFSCNSSPFRGVITLEDWQLYFLAVLGMLSIVWILLTNGLVIFAIHDAMRKNVQRKFYLKLLLLLSCSDVVNAFIAVPLSVVLGLKYARSSFCQLQTTTTFLITLLGHVSGYAVALLALERYLRARYQMNYSCIMTSNRQTIALTCAVCVSVFQATLYLCGALFNVGGTMKKISISVDVFVILVSSALYIRTIRILSEYCKESEKKEALKNTDQNLNKVTKRIFLALCLAFIPYSIVNVTTSLLYSRTSMLGKQWLDFCMFLTYVVIAFNGAVNALILLHSDRTVKSGLKKKMDASKELSNSPSR